MMIRKLCVGIGASLAILVVLALSMHSVGAVGTLIPECNNDPSGELSVTGTCAEVNDTTQKVEDNKLYGPNGILTKAAGIMMYIGGILAVIMIILSGFTFMSGSSDPNTLSAAKKTLLYAVVGVVILVIPSAIIKFVLSRL